MKQERSKRRKAAKSTEGLQHRAAKTKDPTALRIKGLPTETEAEALARYSLEPSVQAALTSRDYNKGFGGMCINTLVDDLAKQCELANNGDLSRAEALLMAQAHALDAIFHTLARKAPHAEYLNQLEVNLRLALKAQSQCRSTLETLAAIKNPQPVAFVRQANIAHGPQQVNNGGTPAASRAEKSKTLPNKLLEHQYGEGLDSATAGTTSDVDSKMETVGASHRP